MAVVIRLQGLPIVAGTMDIRHFFSGLTIPDGGVHIVGGEHGEAFIVFATDEDARLGMMRTGGSIKGSKVSLLLSSKTEMQNMIELSRRRFEAGAGAVETATPAAGNVNRQAGNAPIPTVQQGGGGRSSGHGNHGNQGFVNTPVSVTAASSSQEPSNKAVVSVMPSFPNSYSSAPTITAALASLNAGPPPIPPLPSMPSMPPMPTLPTIPVPLPVSSLPPVPTVSPMSQGLSVSHMSHLSHMSSMPPFNPSLPPPGGMGSGLPLGTPNPMLFNPLSPLASLGLQAHMKAAAAAAAGAGMAHPDELFVLLQNLPFSCSEMEVREFFRGLGVEGARLLRDGQGRPTGRAMVKFFSPQDSFEAVKRGGGMMGQRFIEITPGSERQWASLNDGMISHAPHNSGKTNNINESQDQHHRRGNAMAGGREQRGRSRSPHRQEFCVYLKGLPYEADKKQIKEFFTNLSIMEDSVYIAYGPNGRATGEGFLEFRAEQDYKTALSAHMQYMGTRFIQVHPISRKGMLEKIDTIRKRESSQGDGKNQDGLKVPRNCAHITNIPYNVSKKDVRAFLEGVGLYEDTLKVLTDVHGNGLGQAIFQLRTEEDARKAERLHRQKLNGRDAFVHLVTFDQMKEIERNPPPQNKRGQRNQNQQNLNQNQHQQSQPSPQQPQINPFAGISGEEFNFLRNTMGNLNNAPFVTPFSAPGNGLAGPPPLPPLAAGLGEVNLGLAPPLVAGLPGAPILEPPGFRPGAAGGAPFSQDGLRGLVPFDNANRKGNGGGQTRGGGANNNQGRPGGGATGGQQVFTPGTEGLRNQPAPGGSNNPNSQRGAPGPTIVKLQNMPFTVTVDEIMDFFYGYQVLPGSACLQFSEKGLPTGEAMVAFQIHEEAAAAVMDLNDRPIGARKVKISLG
ncbi:RNA-binding protein 12 [Cyclopterus lumpus]|uniref:RNA binding motif protein 12 n=1 Tax=Cyclopterus lumpus TaxID=8103 RepID=A0A8C3AX31_CYCLU|nr:RNA-binding protein 12 [Cyclopterus lumpus]XP_034387744.1 RNA-binding protein 12 [Cyclopterus lumpus]XP_034387745.1 RNA-binding protein 12 [Cyclopterus lumpus]